MKKLLLILPLFYAFTLQAQPEFNMSDTTVLNCEGILYDSDNGDVKGQYDHNEDYTFHICPEGGGPVSINFINFCTELGFDFLTVYDGVDTFANVLGGPYSGEEDPPFLTSTGDCLTIHFSTDPSVSCTGWTAQWQVEFEIPMPPDILPIANLPCESNQITIELDENVHCDSIYASAFAISGPISPNVTNAVPAPCVGDSTNTITLTFAPPIDFSGGYTIIYTSYKTICETTYTLQSLGSFAVTDCPLNVMLELENTTSCAGDDALLIANATGGDPATYMYEWSLGFSTTDTLMITPFGSTTYYVTVMDGGGAMATDSIVVEPQNTPSLSLPDTMLCQSLEPFQLTGWPMGGEWFANGISEDNIPTGIYNPGLVPYANDTIFYVAPTGCYDSIFVEIIPLDEGTDDASCIGAMPFQVSGGLPLGGIWSGENIDANGLFTPPDSASMFLVTYTHPNGCVGEKWVNIDSITMPEIDSLCQSIGTFDLAVTPFGGVWSGAGIVNEDTGTFDPYEANQGENWLYYDINGCSDSLLIYINEIDALGNLTACPTQAPFLLPGNWFPQDGMWSGVGIVDENTGLFDPSITPIVRDTVWLTSPEGCTDFRIVFVLQTEVNMDEPIYFCPTDDPYLLPIENPTVRPRRGVWSGTSITNPAEFEYYFDPNVAGSGTHILYYTINDCTDSLTAIVYPTPTITPATFCEAGGVETLEVDIAGGTWSGEGIINPLTGIFNPNAVGGGIYEVFNTSPEGCVGSEFITVNPFLEAQIDGLDDFYCYQNSDININLNPLGGALFINGEIATNFNPATLGAGIHQVQYVYGEGDCQDIESQLIEVGEPLEVELPFEVDSVCFGQNFDLTANASGGSSQGNYTYNWNQNLGFGQTQYVSPEVSTTYIVTADDGCSDPASDTLEIVVFTPIYVDIDLGNRVCFDDTTSATAFAFPGDDYTYIWDSEPPTFGTFIESYPTTYNLQVIDNQTNCSIEEAVSLPGYSLLEANFGLVPNDECITTVQNELQLLDYSIGGTNGWWDFGDSLGLQFYNEGENLTYAYRDTGTYIITLHLENEGGCTSEAQQQICVEAEHTIFAPNAMSPNGDGVNDVFRFVGEGVENITWSVYNRYGHQIFAADDMNAEWNGKLKGNRVQAGVYVWRATYQSFADKKTHNITGFVTVIY